MFFPSAFSLFTMLVYILMSYGGIRSPDSEVVFRTTEAIATRGTFAVTEELSWKGFGLTRGTDDRLYSLFGPAQAVAAVPFYGLARLINSTEWHERAVESVPVSHYVGNGVIEYAKGEIPEDLTSHALRSLACLFNPFVSSLCVFVFYLLVRALTQSDLSARLTTILFSFGTLMLPYSGTFFSEPLATFFVMLSLHFLIKNSVSSDPFRRRHAVNVTASGLSLGLATATHLTAILYVPFFCFYAVYAVYAVYALHDNSELSKRRIAAIGGLFILGVSAILVILAVYNHTRFGGVLETGRTAQSGATPTYGIWVTPWRGLWALLISSGKGLLLYCPAILLSIVGWKHFHTRHRVLAVIIVGAAALRILFIASRSDWHGGFCLGPRYMVMLVPLLILPVGEFINNCIQGRNAKSLWAVGLCTLVCIAQQLYFSLGEIFLFLHNFKWQAARKGVDIFEDNFLYVNWQFSPLLYLLEGKRAPFFLTSLPVSNYVLWSGMVLCAGVLLFSVYYRLLRKHLVK